MFNQLSSTPKGWLLLSTLLSIYLLQEIIPEFEFEFVMKCEEGERRLPECDALLDHGPFRVSMVACGKKMCVND